MFVSSEGHWSEVVDDHETKTVSTIDTIDSNKTQLNHKTAAAAWRKRLLSPNFSVLSWNGVFEKSQFQIVQTQLYFWKLCLLTHWEYSGDSSDVLETSFLISWKHKIMNEISGVSVLVQSKYRRVTLCQYFILCRLGTIQKAV